MVIITDKMSYQDKLVFPAPETSYTVETSQGQVIYLPRDIMQKADRRKEAGYPSQKLLTKLMQEERVLKIECLIN